MAVALPKRGKEVTEAIKLDLDAIEAAAKAATPGPWEAWEAGINAGDLEVVVGYVPIPCSPEDFAHIATANPAAVLELIRRLRATESLLDARIGEVSADVEAVALVGNFRPEYVGEMRSFHDALRALRDPAPLVMCVQSPNDFMTLDAEQMRANGWVRAEGNERG